MKWKEAEGEGAPFVWSIAGSDSGGGAGIQADLRVFADFGAHACTVVTAVTAQSAAQVRATFPMSAAQVRAQLDAIAEDFPPRAIKVGMIGDAGVLRAIEAALRKTQAPVVCDPVLHASDGTPLFTGDARDAFGGLMQRADLLTPNIPEAERLSGMKIDAPEDMERAAGALLERGVRSVLIKGGHPQWESEFVWDYWRSARDSFWLRARRFKDGARGTGCILSAAVTAALARGHPLADALTLARAYLQRGLLRSIEAGGRRIIVCPGAPQRAQELPELFPVFPVSPQPVIQPWEGEAPGLYPVVPSAEWVRRVLSAGVRTVQLRIKDGTPAEIASEARTAAECARKAGARLFINDHWETAIACGAWGVHLGQEDLARADLQAIAAAGLRLGISAHCWREIARARALQPSYIALGPVFHTSSKEMAFAPIGLETLHLWNRLLEGERPCAAIGGIGVDNAADVLQTGVAGVAMISAICSARDWRGAIAEFQRLLRLRAAAGVGDGRKTNTEKRKNGK